MINLHEQSRQLALYHVHIKYLEVSCRDYAWKHNVWCASYHIDLHACVCGCAKHLAPGEAIHHIDAHVMLVHTP